MARNTRHKFKNKRQYFKTLRDIPRDVREDVEIAMEKGGDDVVATAKVLVAVVSGDLKNSIRHHDSSSRFEVRRTIRAGGPTAPYVRIVEFGYGRAFFWPAYRANKRRIKGRIKRALNKGMRRAVARNKKG